MWFNQYPYVNLNDLNLDFILKAIRDMKYEVENFVSINAIKYADPIQWDITKHYEKNTVVLDPVSGTAYISVAAVPAGVALTRPEYWTVVFDLQSFVTKANQNLANNYEATTTTTATMNTSAGAWVVWGDVLYKALVNITAGDAYVVGSNIERITIEDVIKALVQDIDNEISNIVATIGDLNDLATTDKSSIVNAINEEVGARIVADNVLQNEIDNIDASIYVNVRDFGATGDGVTDDTQAIQNAVDFAVTTGKNKVFVPDGTYMIRCHDPNMTYTTSPYMPIAWNDPNRHYGITLYSNIDFFMSGGAVLKSITHDKPESVMLRACNVKNLHIHGGHLVGEKTTHTNSGISGWNTDEWNVGIMIGWGDECVVENVEIEQFTGHGMYVGAAYDGSDISYTYTDFKSHNILVDHLYIHNNREVGFQLSHGIGHIVTNCLFEENKDVSAPYGGGLSIEGEGYGSLGAYEYVTDVSVENCTIKNNNYFGLSLSDCRRISVANCHLDYQNDSISLYRNARTIDIHDCHIFGRTSYGGFVITDNACHQINIHHNVLANGRLRINHGTQTADVTVEDLTFNNNYCVNFLCNVDSVGLSSLTFNNNEIVNGADLDGTLSFHTVTNANICGNKFYTDNTTNNVTLSFTTVTNTKINDNEFKRGGGAVMYSTNGFNTSEICGNDIRNYNVIAKRSMIGGSGYFTKYCNNVFRPNLSHANGYMMTISDNYPCIITNNVVLAIVDSSSTPADGLINTNGTNKVAYGNKAVANSVTAVIAGSNLSSIDETIDNVTF